MTQSNAPFDLSCTVTTLNVFSVSRMTIPEQPTRLGFFALRTVHPVELQQLLLDPLHART